MHRNGAAHQPATPDAASEIERERDTAAFQDNSMQARVLKENGASIFARPAGTVKNVALFFAWTKKLSDADRSGVIAATILFAKTNRADRLGHFSANEHECIMRVLRAYVDDSILVIITNCRDAIRAINKLFDQFGHRPDETGILKLGDDIKQLTWANYPSHAELEAQTALIIELLGPEHVASYEPAIKAALRNALKGSEALHASFIAINAHLLANKVRINTIEAILGAIDEMTRDLDVPTGVDHINNDFLNGNLDGARVSAAGGAPVARGNSTFIRGEADPFNSNCSNCGGMGHGGANCSSSPGFGSKMCMYCMTAGHHSTASCWSAPTGWTPRHRRNGRGDGGPAPIARRDGRGGNRPHFDNYDERPSSFRRDGGRGLLRHTEDGARALTLYASAALGSRTSRRLSHLTNATTGADGATGSIGVLARAYAPLSSTRSRQSAR